MKMCNKTDIPADASFTAEGMFPNAHNSQISRLLNTLSNLIFTVH
jgi:hypothetical protein